ncbi:ArsR/SmtB family transcription factor [Pseudonocardia nigra]|uniref:ArsR/SmtB family transcription factor n=1 Tax=Pseudonocardia nigra TaxID=1921578 RepID=UPI001C5F9585|nr:metalloregulator ArsR/SmtB family transcription factor [Pseudonocardia nigra]
MSTAETAPALLPQPARHEIRIATVLQALGDPVRLQIVRALAEDERACMGLACGDVPLPVSKSTVTHHLRTLRDAGVVSTRVEGTRRLSTLRREDLDALYPGLLAGVLAAER